MFKEFAIILGYKIRNQTFKVFEQYVWILLLRNVAVRSDNYCNLKNELNRMHLNIDSIIVSRVSDDAQSYCGEARI